MIWIRKDVVQDLSKRFPDIVLFINRMMESVLINFEKRTRMFRLKDPLQKLETFEKLHPEFSNRLSSKILASYLGVAPQTLSTVRTQRSKKSS